jgi:hypothetical protein
MFKTPEDIDELTPYRLRESPNLDEDYEEEEGDNEGSKRSNEQESLRNQSSPSSAVSNQGGQSRSSERAGQARDADTAAQSDMPREKRESASEPPLVHSKGRDSPELQSHPQASLFRLIDRNSDGTLTLMEFIQALRTQPEVSKVQYIMIGI